MKRCQIPAVAFYSLLLVSALLFLGCEVGSSDSATRNMGVDFTGVYDSKDGGPDFVSPANSGKQVTSLNLRQFGDQLEAIDNNNLIFNGTLNDVSVESGNAEAGFKLEGKTTAGQPVTISGSFSGSGDTAQMRATWIEPALYAYVNGDAQINPIPTGTTEKVSTPTFSPSGGNFSNSVTVTVSTATSDATIRYTINDSDPDSSSTLYSSALTFSATTTLKARAFKSSMTDSDVASATYTKQ